MSSFCSCASYVTLYLFIYFWNFNYTLSAPIQSPASFPMIRGLPTVGLPINGSYWADYYRMFLQLAGPTMQVQRQLQLRIEAQGKYLQRIIEEQRRLSSVLTEGPGSTGEAGLHSTKTDPLTPVPSSESSLRGALLQPAPRSVTGAWRALTWDTRRVKNLPHPLEKSEISPPLTEPASWFLRKFHLLGDFSSPPPSFRKRTLSPSCGVKSPGQQFFFLYTASCWLM